MPRPVAAPGVEESFGNVPASVRGPGDMASLPYSRASRSGVVCSGPPRAEPVGVWAGFGKPAFVGAEDREQDVLHAQPGPLASATFGAGSRNYASRSARTDGDGYRPTLDS